MIDFKDLCRNSDGSLGGHVVLSIKDQSGIILVTLTRSFGPNGINKQIAKAFDFRDNEGIAGFIETAMIQASK